MEMKPTLGLGRPVLGFDVGGTNIKAALIDRSGRVLEFVRVATPEYESDIADLVANELGTIATSFRASFPAVAPEAVGLLVPGSIDVENGIAITAENIGWNNAPLRDLVGQRLSIPVVLGHDVTGAGEAEKRFGAARDFDNVVVLAIGTGIAGAVFTGGAEYRGSGMAGELGHMRLASAPTCPCGSSGCLEVLSSTAALTRKYNEISSDKLTGTRELLARVEKGDARALAVWETALDYLALALCHVVAVLAPEAIVIAGGLSLAGDALFEPLRARVDSALTFQERPRILPAALGERAGVVGAALRARDFLGDEVKG